MLGKKVLKLVDGTWRFGRNETCNLYTIDRWRYEKFKHWMKMINTCDRRQLDCLEISGPPSQVSTIELRIKLSTRNGSSRVFRI